MKKKKNLVVKYESDAQERSLREQYKKISEAWSVAAEHGVYMEPLTLECIYGGLHGLGYMVIWMEEVDQ